LQFIIDQGLPKGKNEKGWAGPDVFMKLEELQEQGQKIDEMEGDLEGRVEDKISESVITNQLKISSLEETNKLW
jgi:hypothetical protein